MARRKTRKNKRKINLGRIAVTLLIIVLMILVVFGPEIFPGLFKAKTSKQENKTNDRIEFEVKRPLQNSTSAMIYLPAVDNNGKGLVASLVVEAIPGSGRTLVDIDNLLFWADTQQSIRAAKKVAANITNVDLNKYDFIYNIYANASNIGGESAGAALTIATIAVIENKSLAHDVLITGTVNHDGTIGPVSGIVEKAKAAKENNASLFLVPLLQSREIIYETRKNCEKLGPAEVCTVEQVPRRVNVSEESGIQVMEVGSIQEALVYFLK
jgi:uncharacterized protein